jgi:hypothetical protein
MAALGEEFNLIDLNRITLQDGKMAKVYDMITKNTPIVRDLMMVQCNKRDIFEHIELTGLPDTYYAALGQGYPKSKAKTKVVRDTCAKHGGRVEIPRDTAELSGDANELMAKQEMFLAKSAMESLEETIIYGTAVDTEEFIGINARLSTPSTDRTESGYNLITGSGTTNLMSILGIVHSTETIHGIYPQGITSGMKFDRYNEVTITDPNDSTRELVGYKRFVEQFAGLAVPDWHGIVRACNIGLGDLTIDASTGPDLTNIFSRMAMRMNRVPIGMKAFYVNDTIYSFLMQQTSSKVGGQAGFQQVQGQEQISYWGIPIKRCDSLTTAEAQVTGTFTTV